MTGTEQNQIRRQQDQAVVDALMSDDAARAIEILYRTVIHGIPVPDPDVVATLAVQPKHPARTWRRHTWIRSAVPLAIGLAAIIGSLGWSYSDYNDRQQEWRRIAEEQTALANQRAQHIAEYDAWKRRMVDHQKRDNERRERIARRFEDAIAVGKLDEAALQLSAFGDWITDEAPSATELSARFSEMVDRLVAIAREKQKQGNDRVSE